MNPKTKYPNLLLVSVFLASLVLGLVFFGLYDVVSNAQDDTQKILIENKAEVGVPNDSNLGNNESIVKDYIIRQSKPPLITGKEEVVPNSSASIPNLVILTQTGGAQPQQLALVPIILIALIVSVTSSLLYKKLTPRT